LIATTAAFVAPLVPPQSRDPDKRRVFKLVLG
jgi:hypothetical protein